MAVGEDVNQPIGKRDLLHLAILLMLALVIGTYLIATTVLISSDGVFYIKQAQKFAEQPEQVIQGKPFGYPFLIFVAHRAVGTLFGGGSVQSWIYAAQSVNLMCRMLALVSLYFLGRLFVGARESFLAILILVFLPYPAEFGSDVLRDWPHLLFLVTGFLLLVLGSRKGKWWLFGVVGLVAGLGYIIRPECAQLIIYGMLWLPVRVLRPKRGMSRAASIGALLLLLVGFAVPMIPYMVAGGRVPPAKLKRIIKSGDQAHSQSPDERHEETLSEMWAQTGPTGSVIAAVRRLIGQVSGDLMHYFMPALMVGIYLRFRKKSALTVEERFFIPVFATFNVALMVLLHCSYGYVSMRHCLPLVAITIFYVPEGLRTIADLLWGLVSRLWGKSPVKGSTVVSLFHIMLVSGLVICVAKLSHPLRIEKQGYRDAANWLKKNTSESDIIAVTDWRITFYAGRKGSPCVERILKRASFALKVMGDENEEPNLRRVARKMYSVPVNQREKRGKRIVIYKLL